MTEYTDSIRSAHLGNDRFVWIRPPRSGTASNLIMFLDGEWYRDRVGAPTITARLRRRGEIEDAWQVFVSMHSVEARWIECPCHPPFAGFVVDELLPRLESCLPEIARASHRVLAGLSYSALAAAYIAKVAPGCFQRIISQSGSYWWNNCSLVEAYRHEPLRAATEFYLEVGRRETQENLRHQPDVLQVISQIDGVRRFRDALEQTGVRVTYRESSGGHDCLHWKRALPNALRWALARRPAVDVSPAAIVSPL